MNKIKNWLFGKRIDHNELVSGDSAAWTHQKNFGLVLGGGSARGIAHIGLVQYLIERNLFPSEIVGTSMGAIVGACFSLGFDASVMKKIAKDFSIVSFVDLHMGEGIVKGDKVLDYLNTLFGNKDFADCLIPLKVVATNIDSGQVVVLDSGNIAQAVRASMSLPGIIAPVRLSGYRLIDGGVVANLPIQYCSCTQIIASSALGLLDEKVREGKTGWIFNNFLSYLQSNKDVLTKALTLLIHQNEQASLSTSGKTIHLLQPKLHGLGFSDFDKHKELVKKGYEEAERVLVQADFG